MHVGMRKLPESVPTKNSLATSGTNPNLKFTVEPDFIAPKFPIRNHIVVKMMQDALIHEYCPVSVPDFNFALTFCFFPNDVGRIGGGIPGNLIEPKCAKPHH
jgi:hypothetical protein